MVEWQVFLAISAVFSFVVVIFKATKYLNDLISSNKNLTAAIKDVSVELKEALEHNREVHKRLWEHNSNQDIILNDHETRISIIEEKHKGGN